MLPDITVALTTYNREEVLLDTLASLRSNLIYSGNIRYLIGNDGDLSLIDKIDQPGISVITNPARLGLGANINNVLRHVETEFVLQSQDDYKLLKPLELDKQVQKLIDDDWAGWIKLKLISGQRFIGHVEDAWWWIQWTSPEMYITSDQPHLKRWKAWHNRYGWYPENLPVALTENGWCSQVKEIAFDGNANLKVLAPIGLDTENSWLHDDNGLSWKDQGL